MELEALTAVVIGAVSATVFTYIADHRKWRRDQALEAQRELAGLQADMWPDRLGHSDMRAQLGRVKARLRMIGLRPADVDELESAVIAARKSMYQLGEYGGVPPGESPDTWVVGAQEIGEVEDVIARLGHLVDPRMLSRLRWKVRQPDRPWR